jgi:hypothetical protein
VSKAFCGGAAPGESLTRGISDERALVTFREGKAALANEPWATEITSRTARDIIGFLRRCEVLLSPACIAMAKGTNAEGRGQARIAGE